MICGQTTIFNLITEDDIVFRTTLLYKYEYSKKHKKIVGLKLREKKLPADIIKLIEAEIVKYKEYFYWIPLYSDKKWNDKFENSLNTSNSNMNDPTFIQIKDFTESGDQIKLWISCIDEYCFVGGSLKKIF